MKVSNMDKELQSREEVNKLLYVDIEALSQTAKVPTGEEALALKQAVATKAWAEEDAASHEKRTNDAVAVAERTLELTFEDALVQVEFFHAPLKVDCSKVFLIRTPTDLCSLGAGLTNRRIFY